MMPFDIYSDKKIVSSSEPIREEHARISMQADSLMAKLQNFEQASKNDLIYNELKKRTQ